RYEYRIDLFLLRVDRDGVATRRVALDRIETRASAMLRTRQCFLAENAWQEIEVWALAGHDLPKTWRWREVRQEVNPKERFFVPFAKERGVQGTQGGGRKILAEEAARRYGRVRRLCPELAALESRVQRWMEGNP